MSNQSKRIKKLYKTANGKTYYQKQPYESRNAGDTSVDSVRNEAAVTIYSSMLQSVAWMNLTGNAKALYLYMKAQAYSKQKKGDDLNDEELEFHFNKALIGKRGAYKGLYKSLATFYKNKQELIDNGFIECVYHDNDPRNMDIYKLSWRWQEVQELKPKKDTHKATEASMKKREEKKTGNNIETHKRAKSQQY